MGDDFGEAMGWVHTTCGIVLGALLFVIFWTGTLSVFDREIDRWMMPATRLPAPSQPFSPDTAWKLTRQQAAGSPVWILQFPTSREPTARVLFAGTGTAAREVRIGEGKKGIPVSRSTLRVTHIDPRSSKVLPDPATKGGSGFFFPFHWNLLMGQGSIGHWIVGLAGMAMLLMIVSGVITHKNLFAQFFTLRARKISGRAILDLHKTAGVLGLPFHFMIAFSGLAIFYFFYFPTALGLTHEGGERQLYSETRSGYSRPAAGAPGELASLDIMAARAQRLWGSGEPAQLSVTHPGDANAYVQVTRTVRDVVTYDAKPIYFDARTGELIKFSHIRPVAKVQRFIAGIHFIFFQHWVIRWGYFILGLTGCGLIASGMIFWLQARQKRKGATRALANVHLITVGTVAGIMIATLVYLIANRLLPAGLEDRGAWEMRLFFLAWTGAFFHAALRPQRAWIEQARAVAIGAVSAVALNAVTTGDHLLRSASEGKWAVFGMDMTLLMLAVSAGMLAGLLRRRSEGRPPAVEGGGGRQHQHA